MPPVSPATFGRLLRGLDQAGFERFVAALWEARGFHVTREGDVLVVEDGTGEPRVLWPVRGSRWLHRWPEPPGRDVDAVVTGIRDPSAPAEFGPDVEVIDADDLRSMALYAIERPTAEDLFDRFFDRPVVTDDVAGRIERARRATRSGGGSGEPGITGSLRRTPVVVAVVAFLVIGAVVVGPAVSGPGVDAGGPPAGSDGVSTPTPVPGGSGPIVGTYGIPPPSIGSTPIRGETPAATATRTPGAPFGRGDLNATLAPGVEGPFPPGLSRRGVTDADTLARSHEQALENRSYRWVRVREEFVNGRLEHIHHETATVAAATVYRGEVLETAGVSENSPFLVESAAIYADGTTRFERRRAGRGNRTVYSARPVRDRQDSPYTTEASGLVRSALDANRSAVVGTATRDGDRLYRVRFAGNGGPNRTRVSGSALIAPTGLVRELRLQYVPAERRDFVVVTFRYEAVGNATVTPPDWYGRAKNATRERYSSSSP